jgi:hypothetical protein
MSPLFISKRKTVLDAAHLLGGFGKFFAILFIIPPDLFFSETF